MDTQPESLVTQHKTDGLDLFVLMMKTGFLTLITLGVYRFWQKTRVRKYLWAATSLNGDSLEYTGKGLEKFLGFLVAIVILAVYLGMFQMLLFFLGLSFFNISLSAGGLESARFMGLFYLNIIAVIPLIFYAIYQSRRYMMGRTRWRGIRMGMQKGAWGYVLQSLGYWLLRGLSLGLLTPLATFKLEKYMAERSYFGDLQMKQGGRWTELYPALKHVLIGGAIILASIPVAIMELGAIFSGAIFFIGAVWLGVGAVYYKVRSFGYLTSHKTLGDTVGFTATPRAGAIIRVYVIASVGMGFLAVGGIFFAASIIGFFMALQTGVAILLMIAFYGLAFLLFEAFSMTMLTQPILEHYITSVSINNPEALAVVAQREEDMGTDAEGFADALDIGGAV